MISKTHLALSIFALSGWVAFYFRSNAPEKVKEKIVFKDREVIKEKIVSKDIVRTVTKPDGTKIVTVSRLGVKEGTKTKEVIEEKESQSVSPYTQSSYSLGVSILFDYRKPLEREYEIEISRRLWISPIWASASVNTKKEITLGLRWEF